MKNCIIIGGGIIGLSSAYYLQKAGHKVSIIDQSSMDFGASYVNAGYLSPSHIIPLAAPGVMKKGLKWMFNPGSPLFIKPRLKSDFLQWAWAFNTSCSVKNVTRSIQPIKDITLLGQQLYSEIKREENFKFQLEKKGLLMICQTNKMLDDELKVVDLAKKEGLAARELSLKELQQIEPNVQIDAKGAVLFECDAHTTPTTFMEEMKAYLSKNGVTILKNEKVLSVQNDGEKIISVTSDSNTYKADEFIVTAGSWSKLLCKKLGIKLLLEAGKGYRINCTRDLGITMPAILAEAKVAVTPMDGFTRFAGTMEIAGINHHINKVRVDAIAKAAHNYYTNITISDSEKTDAACGLRPVTPDGMPYIGKSEKCKNLTIATGHAMLGWSMGTSTGKLVSEIISDKKTSLDIEVYHPDRRF